MTPSTTGLPEHVQKTINDLQEKIREKEDEVLKSKITVNNLLRLFNLPAVYSELGEPRETPAVGPVRRDEYFGQPLATVVRSILMRRRAANLGPASVNEIFDAMIAGGYKFDAKDDENAKRGLRIALTKNSGIFIKLPHGDYGLREWYPGAKEPRLRKASPDGTAAGKLDEGREEEKEPSEFDFEAKEKELEPADNHAS